MQKKILITGASGFIGSAIVAKALEEGYETWAGIRASSSKDMLQDKRINFIDLNYANTDKLTDELVSFANTNGKFDAIVHVAGITKAINKDDFEKINFGYTKNFVDALIRADMVPKSFVFMSTLGAVGVGDEINYTPMRTHRIPKPNTLYGKSKLLAETYMKSTPNFPYVILRPTGVYGPNDKDYLILMKAVQKGVNVGAGFKKQLLSFIYISDLIDIVFLAIHKEVTRREYFVSDGKGYTDDEFNQIVQRALNKKRVLRLKIPLFMVKAASHVSEKIGEALNKPVTFNTDKYKIMKQRNWVCDITPLKEELNFTPKVYLEEGVEKTVAWYKEKGWL
ncbi:MAG: NAD(P)-dependent oxidoreductase [Bacteroidales bacterium]|jgi:nucleoside-diphosphate-sugar epimerase|nr:NAD(P)-dependent oxidoreductase [Bacteroidales bacterium]